MTYLDYVKETNLNIIKNGILRKFPYLGATIFNTKFIPSGKVATASTDGVVVYYSDEFVEKLSFDEKVFLFAHELLHIMFNHLQRRKDKDPELWNIATDAVINQMLKAENLPMPEGGIDMEEAINKSADEIYEKLKEENISAQGGGQDSGESGQSQSGEYNPGEGGTGDHSIWDEVIEEMGKLSEDGDLTDNAHQNGSGFEQSQQNGNKDYSELERTFIEKNQEKKKGVGESIREKMQDSAVDCAGKSEFSLGEITSAKPVVSWRRILRREFDKEEDRWSYRRASEENDFQPRVERLEVQDYPMTEVLLDTSGSVDEDLLIKFLKQLKPLLKESKLRVGCFDSEFYGFTEIKRSKDIDQFVIRGRGWTNFDEALKSFTNDKFTNKIIFTDGEDRVTKNEYNMKMKKVYWIVWGNKDFKPCCGKVIFVNKEEIIFASQFQEDIQLY